jgi:phosphotransferase system  glucose/maltose/N-acetylglucosamine-specific IIC component
MFSKLFLGFSFDYWPEERPAILFFIITLSIMAVYIFATYYALKRLGRRARDD